MMAILRPSPMWIWAVRDLRRHPGYHLLLFCVLTGLAVMTSLWMLLDHTISNATVVLMQQAPAIVIRRIGPGGWLPLPVEPAVKSATAVVGAIDPRPRLWGVATAANGPVTVIGLNSRTSHDLPPGYAPPMQGQALVGAGITLENTTNRVLLQGAETMSVLAVGRMPAAGSIAVHDVLLMHDDDVRRLLGLAPGQASDLVVDVYHEREIEVLAAELAHAFPWPVQIDTRPAAIRRALADIARSTGMGLVAGGPIAAAIVLLVMAMGMADHGRRWEIGLQKALGWTGSDLMRLKAYAALILCLPALTVGLASAYALLYWPGMTWAAAAFFGWTGQPPGLYLAPAGAAGALIPAILVVGLPFFTAGLWSGWQTVRSDPGELLQGGS